MWLEHLAAEFGPHHLSEALRYPQDFLERVLVERKRRWAEGKLSELEETGLANGVELGRKAHGNTPATPDYFTSADGFYDRLEHYRALAFGAVVKKPMTFEDELKAEMAMFMTLGG